MELRRYWQVASAYRWPLIVIPLIAAVIGLAATFIVSPRYVGVATVQIVPDETEPRTVSLRTPDGPSTVAVGFQGPTELLSYGVIEGLATREVAASIVDVLDLDMRPGPEGLAAVRAWVKGAIRDVWAFVRFGYVVHKVGTEAAVEAVSDAVEAQLVRGSYFMRVSATWNDPQTASEVANAAVQAYVAHARRVASTAAAERAHFFEAQVGEARQKVIEARDALLRYSRENDVVPGETVRAAVDALDAAQKAQRQEELAVADARQRLAQAEEQLAAISEDVTTIQTTQQVAEAPSSTAGTATTTRSASPNPVYQALLERAYSLQQEMAGLEARGQEAQNQAAARARDAAAADTRQTEQALLQARVRLTMVRNQLAATQPQLVTEQRTEQRTEERSEERTGQRTRQTTGQTTRQRGGPVEGNDNTNARTSVTTTGTSVTASTSSATGTTRSPVLNPLYQSLKQQEAVLNQEIAGLEARLDEGERLAKEAVQEAMRAAAFQNDQALAEARQRYAAVQEQLARTAPEIVSKERSDGMTVGPATPLVTSTSSTVSTAAPNPVHQALQERVLALQQEVAGVEDRLGSQQAHVQTREIALQDVIGHDGRLAALGQELALASDTYSRRTVDWQNALLEQARPVAQVRLIDPAVAPTYPSWPVKIYWAGIGLAAGLLVAGALVFIHYSTDLSVRSAADAEAALGLPLLAAVPTDSLMLGSGRRNGNAAHATAGRTRPRAGENE